MNPAKDPAVRQTGVGASECAGLFGLVKNLTPLKLWLMKSGLRADDFEGNEFTEWGEIMEPVLLRQYAMRNNVHVWGRREDGFPVVYWPTGGVKRPRAGHALEAWEWVMDTVRHRDHPELMAHLDGVAFTEKHGVFYPHRIVEVKTASTFMRRDWGDDEDEGTDEVPERYLFQAHHQSIALQHDERWPSGPYPLTVDVPVLFGGHGFRVFEVKPEPDVLRTLIVSRVVDFWKDVQDGEAPDAGEHDQDTLGAMHSDEDPKAKPETIFPEDDLNAVARAFDRARADEKDAKSRKAAAGNLLRQRIGDGAALVADGWRATWKRNKDSTSVDLQAAYTDLAGVVALLESTHPSPTGVDPDEILAKHTHTEPGSRVLRVTVDG